MTTAREWAARLGASLRRSPLRDPPAPNAAERDQVDIATEIARRRLQDDENAMRWALGDPKGRRLLGMIIWDLAGVTRLSLSESQTATAAAEGGRNIGLQLLSRIEAVDHHAALVIQAERHEERATAEIRAQRARSESSPVQNEMSDHMPLRDSTR